MSIAGETPNAGVADEHFSVCCSFLQEVGLRIIDYQTYMVLREGAEVLEVDHCGEKVLRLRDGNILKLFRRKRLISSALWYPYAQRFADNARSLLELGIAAPNVLDVFKVPSISRDVVVYQPVPGSTIRELLRAGISADEKESVRARFLIFANDLLDRGVYFRSMHLGNVVYMPDGRFGLIDVADVNMYGSSLSWFARFRFFRRVTWFKEDALWFGSRSNEGA